MNTTPLDVSTLIKSLSDHPDLPVIFAQEGHEIAPNYHITEVKHATIKSLDCGKGTDSWTELVVELLDGHASLNAAYMPSRKILGILKKAMHEESQNENTKLYFEFAPSNKAILKSEVDSITVVDNTITISLVGLIAQCKPYQRALKSGGLSANGATCCDTSPKNDSANSCCNSDEANSFTACCS